MWVALRVNKNMPNDLLSANKTNHLPLQWQSVSLHLNQQVCLDSISFSLSETGITVIMGENGSGKTLLLKLCAGLYQPTTGAIHWHKLPTPPQLTWVPSTTVILNTTVANNLLRPLRHHRAEKPENRCAHALAWAGIAHLHEREANSLSTGEQQLLALARAWSLQPAILLLDEPSANLDPARREQIDQLIQQLSHDCKIILSSHSVAQARKLANDLLLLENGKLLGHLPAKEGFQSAAFQRLQGND